MLHSNEQQRTERDGNREHVEKLLYSRRLLTTKKYVNKH